MAPHPSLVIERSAHTALQRQLRATRRSIWVFLTLALALPASCHALFERNARGFDELAARGAPFDATVAGVHDGSVELVFAVAGAAHSQSVSRDDVPAPNVGSTVAITALLDNPSRLVVGGRDQAVVKAAGVRRFAVRVDLGLFWFFGFAAAVSAYQAHRMRHTGKTERQDPKGYRTRLVLTGFWLAPIMATVIGYHWLDARTRGESPLPVVLAAFGVAALLFFVGRHVVRGGPAGANQRAQQIIGWAAPLAAMVGLVRLAIWLASR